MLTHDVSFQRLRLASKPAPEWGPALPAKERHIDNEEQMMKLNDRSDSLSM
jgi:hypothetical protein